jgi:outer membrane protein assembly factor BamB
MNHRRNCILVATIFILLNIVLISCFGKMIWNELWRTPVGYIESGKITKLGNLVAVISGSGKTLNIYDVRSGEKLWDFSTEADFYALPTMVAGNIYIGDSRGGIYCLSTSGDLLFSAYGGESVLTPLVPWANKLYYGDGASIRCFDLETQSQAWVTSAPGGAVECSVWSPPVIEDNQLYFSCGEYFYCLDPVSGEELWHYQTTPQAALAIHYPPVFLEDLVIIPNPGNTLLALHTADGSLAWEGFPPDSFWEQPMDVNLIVQQGKVLYGVMGTASGAEKGDQGSKPLEGMIVAQSADSGEVIWRNKVENFSGLFWENNRLLAVCGNKLEWLNLEDGTVRTSFEISSNMESPCIQNGYLFYYDPQTSELVGVRL